MRFIWVFCKPTSVKNPQANAILERVNHMIMWMLHTAEIDVAVIVSESDIADFLTNAAWAVRSTYHTVLKASPSAAIFGRDMLFDIPFIADWNKVGDYDVGQGYTGPKNGRSGPGNRTLDPQKDRAARAGI